MDLWGFDTLNINSPTRECRSFTFCRVLWANPVNEPVYLRMVSPLPLPKNLALQQNFPNPFNPGTTIQYNLPGAGPVSLKIYDMAGQVVRHLVDQQQVAGSHQAVWDGLDKAGAPTANGVYLYELRAGEYRALRKMLLLK